MPRARRVVKPGTALAKWLFSIFQSSDDSGQQFIQAGRNGGSVPHLLVAHVDWKDTFEVAGVEAVRFPPTRSGNGAHFELKYAATHSHKRRKLHGTEAQN